MYFSLPSDVSHGAECIVALCDGDSGHLVHGQHIALPLWQLLHQLWVLCWIDEAHQGGLRLQEVCLAQAGGSYLQKQKDISRVEIQWYWGQICVRTLRTKSEPKAPLTSVMVAPASLYCWSENLASSPAPLSTCTWKPCLTNASTPAGDSATRRSFCTVSLGTPTTRSLYSTPEHTNQLIVGSAAHSKPFLSLLSWKTISYFQMNISTFLTTKLLSFCATTAEHVQCMAKIVWLRPVSGYIFLSIHGAVTSPPWGHY